MFSFRCVIDNTAERGSALWGEHGISFVIETPERRVLFDTGQSGEVLAHNASQMGIQLGLFDALVISHAHYDHTGGLERFLAVTKPGIPMYANSDLFRERFARQKDGSFRSIGISLAKNTLSKSVDLCLSPEPVEVLPGVWTTGEIKQRSDFEGRSPQHFIQEGGQWLPDQYRDDLSLVLDARNGLVVVCGCCHAGLLNTLKQIQQIFGRQILAVIGGTHLVSAAPEDLQHTVDFITENFRERIPQLYPNHCTGERAYLALAQAFGDNVHPCPAGTVLEFE